MLTNDPRDQLSAIMEKGRKYLLNLDFEKELLEDIKAASKIDFYLIKIKEILKEKLIFEQESELQFYVQRVSYSQAMQEYLLSQHLAAELRLQEMKEFLTKQLTFLLDILAELFQKIDFAIAQLNEKIEALQKIRSQALDSFIEDFNVFLALHIPQFENTRDTQGYKMHLMQALNPIIDLFKQGHILPRDLNAHIILAKNKLDRTFFTENPLSNYEQAQLNSLNESISDYITPKAAAIEQIDIDLKKLNELKEAGQQKKSQLHFTSLGLNEIPTILLQIEETPLKSEDLALKLIGHLTHLASEQKSDAPELKAISSTQKIIGRMALSANLQAPLKADQLAPKSVREKLLKSQREKVNSGETLKADNSPQTNLKEKILQAKRLEITKLDDQQKKGNTHQTATSNELTSDTLPSMRRR